MRPDVVGFAEGTEAARHAYSSEPAKGCVGGGMGSTVVCVARQSKDRAANGRVDFVISLRRKGGGGPRRVVWRLRSNRRSRCAEERRTRETCVRELSAWSPRSTRTVRSYRRVTNGPKNAGCDAGVPYGTKATRSPGMTSASSPEIT